VTGQVIYLNGRVYTGDRLAEAVGVEGDRIRAVGTLAHVRKALGRGAHELDVGGRTVLPGFVDAHNHFLATGEELSGLDVRYPRVGSIEELVSAVRAAAEETPAGRWIRGFGMDYAKYPQGRLPTRHDLDGATRDHPVAIAHVSGHFVLASSAALAVRGVTDDTPDPKGGALARDGEGRLTGLCLDTAMGLVLPVAVDIGCHGPNFHFKVPLEDHLAGLERATDAYLAAGLTTVGDAQVTRRELTVYSEARRRGLLRIRTVCMPLSSQLDELLALGLTGPFGDEMLSIGPMKFYADGTLIGGTAAFREPYGRHGEFLGSTYWEPDELAEMVGRAHTGGWQVGIHVQGDRAMEMTLDAIEGALRASPRDDHRHRLEHAGYPTGDQLRRIASLGVTTVDQPLYLHDSGDEFIARLGGRAHRLQPLRDELELGIPVVLSSDSFVASYRPLETIQAAVLRRTREGEPIGADQALTVEEAVHSYTVEAARSLGLEDRIGSLEPGKLADLVVLDGDLFTTPPERIAELPVWLTVVGGEPAWRTAA